MPAIFALVWNLITSKIAGPIAIGGLILMSIAFAGSTIKHAGIEHGLRHQVAVAVAAEALADKNLATARLNLATETAALETQGRAVSALTAESYARTSAATKAVQQAHAASAALSVREARIAATKSTADQCASADSVLLGGVQ